MENENKIHLQIASEQGHTDEYLEASAAVDRIREYTATGNRWVYINGGLVSPQKLTAEALTPKQKVVIMNSVVGGSCGQNLQQYDTATSVVEMVDKDGEISLEGVSGSSKFAIVVEIVPRSEEEFRTATGFRFIINKNAFDEVVALRRPISEGLVRELETLAQKELKLVRELRNV